MKSAYRRLHVLVLFLFNVGALPAYAQTAMTIGDVIKDMSSSSEALVISPKFDFQRMPQIIQHSPSGKSLPAWWTGLRPEWCYRILSWHTVYEAEGNAAVNTRVQIARLRTYILSNATKKWTLIDNAAAPATELWKYPYVYVGQPAGTFRAASDGGISVKPVYPNFHHGYGSIKDVPNPQDVRAVFVAMDFRLIVDDPNKPDDRSKARYVVDAGADYYPGKGLSWGTGYAPGVGSGRYLLAKPTWRTATLLVPNKDLGANFDEMKKNPPPLQLTSLTQTLSATTSATTSPAP